MTSQEAQQVEAFMEKNCFRCPLGWVTRKQCETNRRKPNGYVHRKIHTAISLPPDSLLAPKMPDACAACTMHPDGPAKPDHSYQGTALKKIRQKLGMSKKQMAHILGYAPQSLERLEQGTWRPNEKARRILKRLDR